MIKREKKKWGNKIVAANADLNEFLVRPFDRIVRSARNFHSQKEKDYKSKPTVSGVSEELFRHTISDFTCRLAAGTI